MIIPSMVRSLCVILLRLLGPCRRVGGIRSVYQSRYRGDDQKWGIAPIERLDVIKDTSSPLAIARTRVRRR